MTDRRPLYVLGVLVAVMLAVLVITRFGDDDKSTEVLGVTVTVAPEDWRTAIDRLTKIENELFESPDSTRVGDIMTADCTCFAETTAALQSLEEKNRHVDGHNIIVDAATLNQEISNDRVRVFVVLSDNDRPTIDANGNVTSPSPQADRIGLIYTLTRGTDQLWRIADRGPASRSQVEVR